jgi:hypothetical protein
LVAAAGGPLAAGAGCAAALAALQGGAHSGAAQLSTRGPSNQSLRQETSQEETLPHTFMAAPPTHRPEPLSLTTLGRPSGLRSAAEGVGLHHAHSSPSLLPSPSPPPPAELEAYLYDTGCAVQTGRCRTAVCRTGSCRAAVCRARQGTGSQLRAAEHSGCLRFSAAGAKHGKDGGSGART